LAQFRTEGYGEVAEPNRYALFLELLCLSLAQFRTENRYALFLELLCLSLAQFRTEDCYALFLELLYRRGPVRPLDARGVFLFP